MGMGIDEAAWKDEVKEGSVSDTVKSAYIGGTGGQEANSGMLHAVPSAPAMAAC